MSDAASDSLREDRQEQAEFKRRRAEDLERAKARNVRLTSILEYLCHPSKEKRVVAVAQLATEMTGTMARKWLMELRDSKKTTWAKFLASLFGHQAFPHFHKVSPFKGKVVTIGGYDGINLHIRFTPELGKLLTKKGDFCLGDHLIVFDPAVKGKITYYKK